jgi:predicted kinase
VAVVLLQGPSGSGKTTLGLRLSKGTGVPYIGKDTIKELLFDTIGSPANREENYAYGRVAIATLFNIISECIALNKPLIVDCAFYAKEAAADIERYNIDTQQVLQLYLSAPPEVLMGRFNARLDNNVRHLGHGDTKKDDAHLFAEHVNKCQPLDIQNTLYVNTVDLDDKKYEALQRQVDEFLSAGA